MLYISIAFRMQKEKYFCYMNYMTRYSERVIQMYTNKFIQRGMTNSFGIELEI